jgi:hypothetical protein
MPGTKNCIWKFKYYFFGWSKFKFMEWNI